MIFTIHHDTLLKRNDGTLLFVFDVSFCYKPQVPPTLDCLLFPILSLHFARCLGTNHFTSSHVLFFFFSFLNERNRNAIFKDLR